MAVVGTCIRCGYPEHSSWYDCEPLIWTRLKAQEMTSDSANSNMVWINTTDLITLLNKLRREDWKTRNGQVYNNTLEIVKTEIRRLEIEHKQSGVRK